MERQQRYCVNCAARRATSRTRRRATSRRRAGSGAWPPRRAPDRDAAGRRLADTGGGGVLLRPAADRGRDRGDRRSQRLGPRRRSSCSRRFGRQRDRRRSPAPAPARMRDGLRHSKLLASDFSLDKGYTVKLEPAADRRHRPGRRGRRPRARPRTRARRTSGSSTRATSPPTPTRARTDYVLYSGEFKPKGEAEKALGELKKDFPDAEVIAVALGRRQLSAAKHRRGRQGGREDRATATSTR